MVSVLVNTAYISLIALTRTENAVARNSVSEYLNLSHVPNLFASFSKSPDIFLPYLRGIQTGAKKGIDSVKGCGSFIR
jgi:hypothetical protein